MMIVPDASVAVKWLVDEEGTEAAVDLLSHSGPLVAPALIAVEVANALWSIFRRAEDGIGIARDGVARTRAAFDELVPTERLLDPALGLAVELRHPVYDCCYLALAIERGATLVTADRRFLDAALASPYADRVRPL